MSSCEFCYSSEQQSEKQILGFCQRAEKALEHQGDSDTNCRWCTWNDPQYLGKKTGGIGN